MVNNSACFFENENVIIPLAKNRDMPRGILPKAHQNFSRRIDMQPIKDVLRKVVLCVLFICSVIAIFVMSTSAQADGMQDSAAEPTLEMEVQADAEAAEARDNKIAIFVDYVQVCGITTELAGGEVYVPVRLFAEAMLDCRIEYSESAGKLTIFADGLSFEAKCGTSYVVANGRYFYVEEGITLREDGQIWLPLSVLVKPFGFDYKLDLSAKAAYLTDNGEVLEHGDTYYNEKDLYWLSRIINAEARGESQLGQIAVGTVVMNRVKSSRFPNTVYGVVFDGSQFSPAVSGSIYKAPSEKCIISAKIVLEGYRVSDSILFFHSIRSSKYDNFVNTDTEMVIDHQFFYTNYKR